jgi:hypothetical protein
MLVPVAHLGQGMHFGELALNVYQDNPNFKLTRGATVKCLTKCSFATMSKLDYQAILN